MEIRKANCQPLPTSMPLARRFTTALALFMMAILVAACGGSGGADDDNTSAATDQPNADQLPAVRSVAARSRNYVEVGFAEAAEPDIAANTRNYTIRLSNGNPVPIVKAHPAPDGMSVLLEMRPGDSDVQLVPNGTLVLDLAEVEDEPIGFVGDGGEEPSISAIASLTDTTVLVNFSQPVSDEAGYLENYQLQNADGSRLAVSSATLDPNGLRALLTTASQKSEEYDLAVSGVVGVVGELPLRVADSASSFQGMSRLEAISEKPTVVSAGSTGNTSAVWSSVSPWTKKRKTAPIT